MRLTKRISKSLLVFVLCMSVMWVGIRAGQAVIYTHPNYRAQHWDLLMNSFIDAVQSDVTTLYTQTAALANTFANWVTTVDQPVLITATPVFVNDHTFTLAGDYTAVLPAGKRMLFDLGQDPMVGNTVVSSTYSSPNTTVVVTFNNLTGNLQAASYYATRSGTRTYGSGDIVASEYGSPSWANLQAAISVSNAAGRRLVVTPGTWPVTGNIAITSPCTVSSGAILDIATGVVLSQNGSFSAGGYQVFSYTGTGNVVFGVGSVNAVLFDWWGPTANGIVDDSAKLQKAIDSLATAKGTVRVGSKSYALASRVNGRYAVQVCGVPEMTKFIPTGTDPAFGQAEDFYDNTASTGYWTAFRDFTIDASANTNDMDLMYFDRNFNMCAIRNINFYGNPAKTQTGLHVYHTNPDTGLGNLSYHNFFHGLNFINCKSANGAMFLDGSGTLSRRINDCIVDFCKFSGYKVGLKVGGIGNRAKNCAFNVPDNPVLLNNTGGTDFRVIFYDGTGNALMNNFFDLAGTHVVLMMYGQAFNQTAVCDIPMTNPGLTGINQIADLASAVSVPYCHVATYSAADTLVVATNVTATYPVDRQVWVDCGTDGWRTSTVLTSTYSAPNTTIVLNDSVLTSNLATVSSAFYADRFRPHFTNGYQLYYQQMMPSRLYLGNGETKYLDAAKKGSVIYDFSATPLTINAGVTATLTLPIDSSYGLIAGMAVTINTSTAFPVGVVRTNAQTSTDSIVLKLFNPTAAPITINTSQTFKWAVFEGV